MKKMFEPVDLGQLRIKNRIVRSATVEKCRLEDGAIDPALAARYRTYAEGEVGMIITGMAGVGRNACLGPGMINLMEQTPADIKVFVDGAQVNGCKVVVQLSHCGAVAQVLHDGDRPFGPSELQLRENAPVIRAMTTDEIADVVRGFADSALKCKQAGADGVQLHGAHGYLICQFLSPFYNKRTDAYGGPIENRARLLFEAYDAVRAAVGANYPVMVKINYSDLVDGGLTPEDSTWVCQELDRRGIDAIELSAGVGLGRESSPSRRVNEAADEAYFAQPALELAEVVNAAVISVGGYRTPAVIEDVLNRGKIAAVSMCRPFIREPGLAARWKAGDLRPAECISCSKCFAPKTLICPVIETPA